MLSSLLAAPLLAEHGELLYQIALGLLALALGISVISDLRSRLIYNWVTLPALLLELVLVVLAAGLIGLERSAMGLLICAGPFALGSIGGAIGMGDVKLMAVVGVVAGAAGNWSGALNVLLYVTIAGGAQAAGQWIYAAIRKRERPKYVPYGVAIAAGTLAAWLFS